MNIASPAACRTSVYDAGSDSQDRINASKSLTACAGRCFHDAIAVPGRPLMIVSARNSSLANNAERGLPKCAAGETNRVVGAGAGGRA